jgi:hypothetical protein
MPGTFSWQAVGLAVRQGLSQLPTQFTSSLQGENRHSGRELEEG